MLNPGIGDATPIGARRWKTYAFHKRESNRFYALVYWHAMLPMKESPWSILKA